MNDHFSPVANPAPPRPRCPDALTSLTSQSRPFAMIALVPSQAPRPRAPIRPQSPLSSSMRSALGESCQRCWPADRRGQLAVNLRAGLRRAAGGEFVQNSCETLRREVLVVVIIDLRHRRVHAGPEALDLDPRECPIG